LFLTYVLSSWWSWYYGSSYGLRAYIDYYAIFFIPFALFLDKLRFGAKLFIVALAFLAVPINIIQTYQYKKYILHWVGMNKEKYWKVFLKTDKKYEGILWKKNFNQTQYTLEKEMSIGNVNVTKGETITILVTSLADIPNFDNINTIQILIDHHFNESINTDIGLKIADYHYFKTPLIHFIEKDFNEFQEGIFNYKFDYIENISNNELVIKILAQDSLKLKNIKVKFFSQK
jgi:hypothetical protein